MDHNESRDKKVWLPLKLWDSNSTYQHGNIGLKVRRTLDKEHYLESFN